MKLIQALRNLDFSGEEGGLVPLLNKQIPFTGVFTSAKRILTPNNRVFLELTGDFHTHANTTEPFKIVLERKTLQKPEKEVLWELSGKLGKLYARHIFNTIK